MRKSREDALRLCREVTSLSIKKVREEEDGTKTREGRSHWGNVRVFSHRDSLKRRIVIVDGTIGV